MIQIMAAICFGFFHRNSLKNVMKFIISHTAEGIYKNSINNYLQGTART